jgi:hypothetical protein
LKKGYRRSSVEGMGRGSERGKISKESTDLGEKTGQ